MTWYSTKAFFFKKGVADLKYESKCRDVPWYVSTRVWNHTTSFSYMDSATPQKELCFAIALDED
jgi:hypothetical protein